jgi:putative flippase GtrA
MSGAAPQGTRWSRVDRSLRYLIVGGWNSAISYLSFVVCWYVLNAWLAPSLIVVISYVLASINGYLTFRYLVFAPAGHPLAEYVRYQAVYLPILALNAVFLPVVLAVTGLNAYVAQLLFAGIAITLSYLGNKYFVFSKSRRA